MSTKNSTEYILSIDTTSNREASVVLKSGEYVYAKTREYGAQRSQVLFPLIVSILAEHAISLRDLSALEVNLGPGSYTGLRVGTAVANALGFFLNIPVNGGKLEELVDPIYT